MFQGWVSWRAIGASGDGHVVVTLTTPGNGERMYRTPKTPNLIPGERRDYSELTETEPYGDRGVWVIGHEATAIPSSDGDDNPDAFAGSFYPEYYADAFVTEGPVIRTRPSQRDGGLAPDAAMSRYEPIV